VYFQVVMQPPTYPSPRDLVDFVLRELLRHKQQQKILSLKGKVTWAGDLAEMRTGRGQ
jgi:hypothetical protein